MKPKYKIIKGTKFVKKWVKPHKVRGYYRWVKINVYLKFKLKQIPKDVKE